MVYDHTISARTVSVSSHSAMSKRLYSAAESGDVVIAPPSFEHESLRVSGSGVVFSDLTAETLRVDGNDVSLLLERARTDRLRDGELTDANFTAQCVTGAKLSGPLPVYLGGTGVAIGPHMTGLVATGGGAGASALRFDSGLSWSGSALDVSGEIEIDGDVRIYEDAGRPLLSCGDSPALDLSDYSGGVSPSVHVYEPSPGYSDSNVTIDYSATGDVRAVFVSVYDGSGLDPRFEGDVATGEGAIYSVRLDVGAGEGTHVITGLESITKYVVTCAAMDLRGNLSAAKSLAVRTTELGAPVALIGSVETSPKRVAFSASSDPKASSMIVATGLLTSRTPALTRADVESRTGQFHVEIIPANVAKVVTVSFAHAYDPGNEFAREPVRENATYHPFAYYRDAEDNHAIVYGPSTYNPDVTAPVFYSAPYVASSLDTSITIQYGLYDAVGTAQTRVYASLVDDMGIAFEPSVADVLSRGQQIGTGPSAEVTEYHSDGIARPLLHTAIYRLYVAAVDAAGNASAMQSVDARTRDSTPPRITAFSATIDPGSSNVTVNVEAVDEGPAATVTAMHLLSTATPSLYTPEHIATQATASFPGPIATATFLNIPAYLPSHVYAVCEDNASKFGAPGNLLSAVSSVSFPVPQVSGVAFEQGLGRHVSISDGGEFASQASPTRIGLFVFNGKNADFLGAMDEAAMSNIVFGSAYGVSTVYQQM